MSSKKRESPPSDDFNDTEWFYGNSRKRKADEEVVKIADIVQPESKRPTLVDVSTGYFKGYNKQRIALEELEKCKSTFPQSRIFSYEKEDGGSRAYMVTTPKRFWGWYENQPSPSFYELITEDTPSRLYFDLEYMRSTNQDVVEKEVFDYFTTALREVLQKEYNINLGEDKMVILDSSSSEKYSKHVICHFDKGLLFPSNVSIMGLMDKLKDEFDWISPVKIMNSDGKETYIFDTSVYSRNRNFRLFKSTKKGKNRYLTLAPECTFYVNKKVSDYQIFLDSLCVPLDYSSAPLIDLPKTTDPGCSYNTVRTTACNSTMKEGSGPSPFPQIDEFLLMVWRKFSSTAYLKQWKLQQSDKGVTSVIYYPGNCRHCFNINRQHKSNGTYWTVNLERKDFVQKCFDPDCKGAMSNLFPLPKFIAETIVDTTRNNDALQSKEEVDSFFEESFHEVENYFTNWEQVFDT